ncbi:YfiR/HmsC family protein [Pleionea sediminis]|uniref:YfiR/HmsC family protein n=1 Tax=Pleionea sediminis TaxID=2569479 RepID=UPI0011849C48|nr:YfiR/HmsC family protein [Pleionea sediminis]
MRRLCFYIFLTALTQGLIGAANSASQPTEEALKSAYIYNFTQYISWPDEGDSKKSITLTFFGDNENYWNSLQNLKKRSVRRQKFELRRATSVQQVFPTDILVIGPAKNSQFKTIAQQLGKKATLLISEGIEDKSKIGINFIKRKDQTLSFEVNRYNLLYQQLNAKSEIIILGGTEIEIATLVKDMERSLEQSREQLSKQTQELKSVQNQVTSKQKLLDAQSKKLEEQTQKFEEQQKKLDEISADYQSMLDSLQVSRQELSSNNELLGVKQEELQEKESEIQNMSELIKKNKQLLINQTNDLNKQREELEAFQEKIKRQTESLAEQNLIIKSQTTALYGSIAIIVFIVIIIILIYRSAKLKQKTNKKLEQKNSELERINSELRETQEQLVASEKMAALGGLVAGVAHEINTPVGVSVTSATHITDMLEDFKKKYDSGEMKRSDLEHLMDELNESSTILNRNLVRASDLIRSFKQVSVDQTTDEARDFNVREYLNEVVQNLRHKLKQKKHKVNIEGEADFRIHSFAGIFAQVFTNLIVNSVIHGFGEDKSQGVIRIIVSQKDGDIIFDYFDNGKGIPDNIRDKIFNPFFTTNRTKGGTGLGLHICYNLVSQKLHGDILCLPVDKGAHFKVTIPINSEQ